MTRPDEWVVETVQRVASRLESQGVPVAYVDGWEDRGRPWAFDPRGLVIHHTATQGYQYDYASLGIVRDGRSDLPGPLAQFGIGRHTGTVYVVASGYCLEGGTSILTRRGLVPIETVEVGDEVWTHRNRWRSVTAVASREAESVALKGFGHPRMVCSTDHPWFSLPSWPRASSRLQVAAWDNAEMEIVEAGDMPGRCWLSPSEFGEDAELPDIEGVRVTPEIMRVVGAWVADGAMGTDWQPRLTPRIAKAEVVEGWLDASGFRWHRRSDYRGVARVGIGSAALGRWLVVHFGRRSTERTIPAWLLGAPDKFGEAFLDGYLHGDGHQRPASRGRGELIDVRTSSRCLAFGLRLLANRLGLYAYVTTVEDPKDIVIAGRKTRGTCPSWTVIIKSYRPHGGGGRLNAGRWAGHVREATPLGRRTLYDLAVDEDHSFVADGLLTHNSNHAGEGGWNGLSGNGSVWGIEAENDGIGEEWNPLALRSYVLLAVALCIEGGFGPDAISCHREWSPYKIDPTAIDGDDFRSQVANDGPIDEEDEMTQKERETLQWAKDILDRLVAGVHPQNDDYGGAEEINRVVKEARSHLSKPHTGGGVTLKEVRDDLKSRL